MKCPIPTSFLVSAFASIFAISATAEQIVKGRRSLVFEGASARLVVDIAGGSIVSFRLNNQVLNPLNWGNPAPGDASPKGIGHFLCLDRWGPPSEAEGQNGMPYHGEAARVHWSILEEVERRSGAIEAQMEADLPIAGLNVRRRITMSESQAVFVVEESVTNRNPLGRIYNMVQHPTVGPPFLDESTVVDTNGREGFAQGNPLPNPEKPSFYWPQALNHDGTRINLRHLVDDHHPNVVSYAIEEQLGWVTAATASKGLLIGYVWKMKDYPWVSLWRNVREGKPHARGLEFGTTGLHQPFGILVEKGKIFERPLFEHLDAKESTSKAYICFLLGVPSDFKGVDRLEIDDGTLTITERDPSQRTHQIQLGDLRLP